MQTLQSFTDERSGDAAVAAEAFACGSEFIRDDFARRNSVELPDTGAFANPALLAVGGGNPDSGLFATVVYQQGPFGLELVDVFVGNHGSAQRVYDNQMIVIQHELGSDPKQVCACGHDASDSEFNRAICLFNGVDQHLNQEQSVEKQSHNGPGKVAFGSENIFAIHASIIAGASAIQEGK